MTAPARCVAWVAMSSEVVAAHRDAARGAGTRHRPDAAWCSSRRRDASAPPVQTSVAPRGSAIATFPRAALPARHHRRDSVGPAPARPNVVPLCRLLRPNAPACSPAEARAAAIRRRGRFGRPWSLSSPCGHAPRGMSTRRASAARSPHDGRARPPCNAPGVPARDARRSPPEVRRGQCSWTC